MSNVLLALIFLVLAPTVMRGLATAQAAIATWLMDAPVRSARLAQAHGRQLASARDAEAGGEGAVFSAGVSAAVVAVARAAAAPDRNCARREAST